MSGFYPESYFTVGAPFSLDDRIEFPMTVVKVECELSGGRLAVKCHLCGEVIESHIATDNDPDFDGTAVDAFATTLERHLLMQHVPFIDRKDSQ